MQYRRPLLAAAAAISTIAVLAPSASAGLAKKPAQAGALSYRLALVAKRSFGKVSTRAQAERLSLPARGAGSLLRRGSAYVVDVRSSRGTDATARRLRGLSGVRVLGTSSRYRTVTAAVAASALHRVASQPRVASVTEELTPMVAGRGKAAVCHGSITSEGVAQLHADQVQSQFGDLGAGVKVGILSDSLNRDGAAATHAANDVASGDLPGPGNPCGHTTGVQVLDDSVAGEDEGRGMLQIVHDMAPAASLAFATAFSGETNFANNIRALAANGAKVIADDVTYFDEPFFQDGPVAVAVNDVTAGGVTYFSSAGNNNLIDAGGRNIASWETPAFRDAGVCPFPAGANDCMDFDPGAGVDKTFGITISPNATLRLDMQYAEPWFGVTDDIDTILLNSANNTILAAGASVNTTTQKPFEFFSFTNPTAAPLNVNLEINRFSGTGLPRTKFALVQNGGGVSATEYPSSSGGDVVGPTIFGHNGALNAMSTAAVPFNNSNAVERFSSRGPVTQLFGPVNGTTPAAPIAPTVLNKPDIAATDCGLTTFFVPTATPGVFRFCGTSAAVPHAAGVAALERSQNPAATVAQVKADQISTAVPVDSFAHDAAGAGLLNAAAAVRAIDAGPPAKARITKHPKKRTRNPKATFKFIAGGASSFQCKLDHKPFKRCKSPKKVKVKRGKKHTFRVRGIDNLGKVGPASGKFKWTVEPRRRHHR